MHRQIIILLVPILGRIKNHRTKNCLNIFSVYSLDPTGGLRLGHAVGAWIEPPWGSLSTPKSKAPRLCNCGERFGECQEESFNVTMEIMAVPPLSWETCWMGLPPPHRQVVF